MSVRNSMMISLEEQEKKSTSIWTPTVITATILMLLTGTMNSLSFKYQGELSFKHGIFQTSFMFIGEWLNVLFFGVTLCTSNLRRTHFEELKGKASDGRKELKASKLVLALPGLLDSIGST